MDLLLVDLGNAMNVIRMVQGPWGVPVISALEGLRQRACRFARLARPSQERENEVRREGY